MRRVSILFFVLFLSLGFAFYRYTNFYSRRNLIKTEETKTLGAREENKTSQLIEIQGTSYYFDYFEADPNKLFLFANFEKGEKAEDSKARFNCRNLANGGFYDEKFRPIGLFISEYKEISSWQKNRLFNGVFSINMFGTSRITREPPRDPLRIAVQSGPLVFENGGKVTFRSSRDYSRRVVVAVTSENKPLFIVFYSPSNFLEGPKLDELPLLIEKINSSSYLSIADALNLDGGTASAFYSDNFGLGEVSKVGSFFCDKE
jgi:uncharacterized protein YigE (DUF2233 family)